MSDSTGNQVPSARQVVTPKHASSVHLAITNSDFVLVFAVLQPFWESGVGLVPGMQLEEMATVSLSPIAAKQLLRQLTLAIDGFEAATNSTIPETGEIAGSGIAVGPANQSGASA